MGEVWGNKGRFRQFAKTFSDMPDAEWGEVMEALDRLVEMRNVSAHRAGVGVRQVHPDEVEAIYREFVGLGQRGVLQRLLELRLKAE